MHMSFDTLAIPAQRKPAPGPSAQTKPGAGVFIDVTAVLMGDPAARDARPPTPAEMHRLDRSFKPRTYTPRGVSFHLRHLPKWPIGETRLIVGKRESERVCDFFRFHKGKAKRRRLGLTTTYEVTRVK